MQKKGNKYGTHRVIEPKGVLTQAAYKIDNNMDEIYSNEILCNVTALNVDSASFTQIADVCGHDDQKIGEMILSIVAERGKQQNPVTGSGGMFMGTVAKIGDDLKGKIDLKEGDRIASLVSLSLTPLTSTGWMWKPRPSCLKAASTPSCPTICPSLWPWPPWTWPALPPRPASCPRRATAS